MLGGGGGVGGGGLQKRGESSPNQWGVWLDGKRGLIKQHGRSATPYPHPHLPPPPPGLVGLVVKAPASRAEDPEFESRLRRDFFRGRVIPVT